MKKIDFDLQFGGVFYIFLRGLLYEKKCGIFHFYPDLNYLNLTLKSDEIC
jgi:hypothetical protein